MMESLGILRGLSAVHRYSLSRLLNPESVLEHLGFCTLLCYIICERLKQCGEIIDTGIALRKAIIHDIEEKITGDIPSPTKYYSPEITKSLKEFAKIAAAGIEAQLGIDGLKNEWLNAKEGKEGAVLAFADIVAVVCKVWQETVLYGNHSMVNHVGPTREILDMRWTNLKEYLVCDDAKKDLRDMNHDLMVMLREIEEA